MQKDYCDICGKETRQEDLRVVKIEDLNRKPLMVPKEVCAVFCLPKIKEALQ